MPEDVEGMLDSMGFEADIGLLWDSMSAFATNDVETGVSASITVNDGQERRGHIEATVDAGPSLASSVSLGATAAGQMVTMRSEDREPLQHYLSTMVQFAKIRSSAADNIYCYIFTNMGLTHAPLYESILAWAALHLAHVKSSTTADAETRYQRASALLFDDLDAAGHVELTLVTVWFLLQYELFSAKGVDGFIRLLSYAADIVEGVFQVGHLSDIKQQLGPVGVRVLMWLSAYDGRAASFGNPCRLLRCLKMHPSVYNIIDNHGQGTSVDPMRAPIEFATAELRACLRLALRLNILKGSCLLLGRWRDDNMEHDAAWAALYSSLQTIKEEVEDPKVPAAKLAMRVAEGDMNVPTAANTLEFNRMQLLATYYSTIVLYMQHCPAALPTEVTDSTLADPSWPSVRDCAARIIRLSRHVALSRPNSPQAIWPQILFQAGVETDDPIYLSWVLGAFAQAEAWGPNLRKTRQLLERVIEVRRDLKAPLDIPTLMDGMGGPFIL
ncbi:hypothetical protein NKR23_g11524 [Pleurostoma richardsiae]|uniref:Uncharacterized protein n=1 Tax=Pleurostoma richardsiae TaxID=41990 RepID=A0AA38R2X6_9PEZI|nr:hypothetical protein NKR23_g11524 [Pleurostoma richardsiae]